MDFNLKVTSNPKVIYPLQGTCNPSVVINAEVIQLVGIHKTYPKNITALHDLSLSVSAQELVGLIGANGSGKSTLLKIMAGQITADHGSVKILQTNAQPYTAKLQSGIGYISQDLALDPEMTGKESLVYFGALYGLTGQGRQQRIAALVDEFGMQAFITRRVGTYSGGQMQRLHLAIGIIHQPKLLLLDEPSNALDPSGKAFLWQFMQHYQQQGNTLLVISHDLDNIQQHCSRVIMLDNGRIVTDDTPANIVHGHTQPTLHIKSSNSLKKNANLEQALLQAMPNATVQFDAQAVVLIFEQADKPRAMLQTLQIFADQQQPVTECHWEELGLAQAYFQLTGASLANTVRPGQGGGKPGSRKLL